MLLDESENSRTLYCGGLSDDVTEELLYELFLQAGPLEKVRIPLDKDGRKSKFGFVTFKHAVSVPYTIDLMRGIQLFGRVLRLQPRTGSALSRQNSENQLANQTPPPMMMGPSAPFMPAGSPYGLQGAAQFHRSYSTPTFSANGQPPPLMGQRRGSGLLTSWPPEDTSRGSADNSREGSPAFNKSDSHRDRSPVRGHHDDDRDSRDHDRRHRERDRSNSRNRNEHYGHSQQREGHRGDRSHGQDYIHGNRDAQYHSRQDDPGPGLRYSRFDIPQSPYRADDPVGREIQRQRLLQQQQQMLSVNPHGHHRHRDFPSGPPPWSRHGHRQNF